MRKKHFLAITVLTFMFMLLMASPLFAATTHKVKKGDTLFRLSRNYGVSIAEIKSANGLKSDLILIGQVLRIPTATTNVSRSGRDFSQAEINWLARVVHGEARGESYTGQVAVAAVVLNRVDSRQFPNTVQGVVFQPGAFTAVTDGQINLTPNTIAYRAVREAIAGSDPSGGALYYWNPAKATSKWIWSRTIINRIGNHVFGI
ncbi:MAG TPA: LysM peptidoglycan-binding domain-containing protein [Clostridia bacterium]|jgi:N-acetylmuramoyl-L-alanine amidase|nr:cell wall hydrolase [Clostridia bacterium]HHY05905.1 LysM peptidoglycan-binding domain-containing protein [Clostridia bacterium]